MDQLISILTSPVILIAIGVVALVVAAKFTPWHKLKIGALEAERDSPSKPYITKAAAADMARNATMLDLEQYGEVTGALAELVNSDPANIELVAREWFSMLATRLAARLKADRDDHYRAAIWLDDPEIPEYFVGIGRGMFADNDVDMDRLERKYTIGGLAFESANMTYYCRDRRADPAFKARKNIPPSFESVFGLALGTLNDRWGVMTVDARKAHGFPEHAQWLIRRFGELASLGAIVWANVAERGPVPPASRSETPEGL